ncbi:hypothetical protein FB451DRAFT_1400904 [Mycena latifolia]|nr:hypothetical protein FB451DRAFT_1400904 [Mycena latifolia]
MPTYDASHLILPLFTSPWPAPTPPSSSISSESPQGFVLPSIPPRDCPLVITVDDAGHQRLPAVSNNLLPLDHDRVRKLIRHCADRSIFVVSHHTLQRVLSPDSDTIFIPSDDEDTSPNKDPIPSPIEGTDATTIASPTRVRSSVLLSPLPELESLMFSIRLTSPALAPPASPSSPTQSLLDLVPIYPPSSQHPANGPEFPAAQDDSYSAAHTRNPGAPQIRASTPPSKPKLYRQLTDVEAEIQRLAAAQEHLHEQIQAVQEAFKGQGKASDP